MPARPAPEFTTPLVRLVNDRQPSGRHEPAEPSARGSRRFRWRNAYRPIVVGPAILEQLPERKLKWKVDLVDETTLRPRPPGRVIRRRAVRRRLGLALIVPEDLPSAGRSPDRPPVLRPGAPRAEMYGWSLAYRLPGGPLWATIDPHEEFDDLPAFYESPLELLDRATFLRERGIRSRPFALITQPSDFQRRLEGGRLVRRNRYLPAASFWLPGGTRWPAA